jgi:polyisoprenyl-phosphate glycosyltransferase
MQTTHSSLTSSTSEILHTTLSVVVPAYNEAKNLPYLVSAIDDALRALALSYELILVNDGSTDSTREVMFDLSATRPHLRVIDFSRNFGKEAATTAGIVEARGDAVVILDADMQHPPHLIPQFVKLWQHGADVVIGVRTETVGDTLFKRIGSRLYYRIINALSETPIVPRATDFRILDRQVVDAFNTMREHSRMTRGLIDWLGFRREYIVFDAPERLHGEASYRFWKLVKLATESFIAHSLFPLRLAGYVGIVIMIVSGLLGALMIADRYYEPLGFNFSGPAILADIILFMVGIVLIMLGLLSYYIGHIFLEAQNRPLYVIRTPRVHGVHGVHEQTHKSTHDRHST